MSEVEKATVEKQPEEAPAAEQPEKKQEGEKKPAKEKKTKAPKEKKPKAPKPKTAAHPPYFEMIKEALMALNEKSGSSPYAIAKYMEEHHKAVLPANFRKILGLQLKNSAARGKLIKIKASYKLSEAGKKVAADGKKPGKPEKAAKPVAAKPKVAKMKKKKSESVKKATVKTPTKKRSAPAAKPKQPKSIKSPAAKKARKAVKATA